MKTLFKLINFRSPDHKRKFFYNENNANYGSLCGVRLGYSIHWLQTSKWHRMCPWNLWWDDHPPQPCPVPCMLPHLVKKQIWIMTPSLNIRTYIHTIVVGYSCCQFSTLHKVDTEAVVPVPTTHHVLVIGGQNKQAGPDSNVLGKRPTHKLPSRPKSARIDHVVSPSRTHWPIKVSIWIKLKCEWPVLAAGER